MESLPNRRGSHVDPLQTASDRRRARAPGRRAGCLRAAAGAAHLRWRHCLRNVAKGEPYLVLAYRPFPTLQPYAETGPIFLHAEPCESAAETDVLPDLFRATPDYIVRGYGHDDRIVYGTGAVVPSNHICQRAHELLARPEIAYLHMRSARNNCYQCRSDRN